MGSEEKYVKAFGVKPGKKKNNLEDKAKKKV
jgi:hypothetical protein